MVVAGGLGISDGDYSIVLYAFNQLAASLTFNALAVVSTNANDTLSDFVDGFYGNFVEYIQQGETSTNNKLELSHFTFVKVIGGTETIILSQLNLRDVLIEFNSVIDVKVQNRTTSATGGIESDDVSASAIQGRMYEFSGPPKPKAMNCSDGLSIGGSYKFTRFRVSEDGCSMFNPGGMDTTYKEPPLGQQFYNCTRASRVVMDPGVIKVYKMHQYKRMTPLLKVLKMIHLAIVDDVVDIFIYNNWKTFMLSMEDVINLNGSAVITLGVEVERRTNVTISEKAVRTFKPQYVATSMSEV